MTTTSLTTAKDWRGLTPLVSTRVDVERLLGAPEEPGGSSYKSGEERIRILYSKGVCGDDSTWSVPRDTAVKILVYPRNRAFTVQLLFKELQMDRNTFIKNSLDFHVQQTFYDNSPEGVWIEVDNDKQETVLVVTYGPADKDEYLCCPGYPKPQPPTCSASSLSVSIDGPTGNVVAGTPIKLLARVGCGGCGIDPPWTFRWMISAGKMSTPVADAVSITVDTTGLAEKDITAKLEVGGLPEACPNTASYKVHITAPAKTVKPKSKQSSR